MKRPRDNQRSRLYASEWECFGWPKMEFDDIDELSEYVWKVLSNHWVQQKYELARKMVNGEVKLKISNGSGQRRALARRTDDLMWISFPRKTRARHIVLHELAHILTPMEFAGHGREFARTYLSLVRIIMGVEKEKQLKAAMKKHKCKYSKTHTRWKGPISQEEKDVMLARLLAGRMK